MSDAKGALEKVLEQMIDPLDWVAAGVGAIGGLAVSTATHFTDAGTSIGGGALAGVTARKSVGRALEGWRLGRRADGLEAEIRASWEYKPEPLLKEPPRVLSNRESSETRANPPLLDELLARLQRERRLWRSRAITNAQFSEQLDEIVRDFRKAPSHSTRPPPARAAL